MRVEWSRHSDLNRGPAVYEVPARWEDPESPSFPVQIAHDRGSAALGVNPVKVLINFTDL